MTVRPEMTKSSDDNFPVYRHRDKNTFIFFISVSSHVAYFNPISIPSNGLNSHLNIHFYRCFNLFYYL